MKTRKFIMCFLLCAGVLPMYSALNELDLQHLSEHEIIGTARYMGMAGAMTAVGGDPSALLDNPAGLGIYRRFEISATLQEKLDYTQQHGDYENQLAHHFEVPQLTFVFAFGSDQNIGLKYSNFMFGYNRIKSFNRSGWALGENGSSLADLIADKTQGLPYGELAQGGDVWSDENVGWLSALGFNAFMINPLTGDSSSWRSFMKSGENVGQECIINESGYMDEFNLMWGGNVNDRFYFGMALNFRSLTYAREVMQLEHPEYPLGATLSLQSNTDYSGIGINGNFGIMVHPIRALRIGASIQTPTSMTIRTQHYSVMKTNGIHKEGDKQSFSVETPDDGFSQHEVTPLRLTAGLATFFGPKGLLSLEYDYEHRENIADVHTLKCGVECVMHYNWFLNLGYAYQGTMQKEDTRIKSLPLNSVYTDPSWQRIYGSHYIGVALGYRAQKVIVQLGYQYRWQTSDLYAHEWQTSAFEMEHNTHRIALTIGWHNAR